MGDFAEWDKTEAVSNYVCINAFLLNVVFLKEKGFPEIEILWNLSCYSKVTDFCRLLSSSNHMVVFDRSKHDSQVHCSRY